jgi:tRNA threonylcarbamoyladenosine biosynthesis protein TsaB
MQILSEIEANCDKVAIGINELSGIVVYQGPGSYTGLRISITTANAIGYSHNIPIFGSTGDDWVAIGINKLENISTFAPISPIYGGEVYTTKPKK